ncbi:MAG: tyrosine-type recombinase/integrase [Pleurocapsa sp. MO_192.B19]|nr:tyrosine-type recombinase/integrase [Pleurocapsa sp. MO_192.B19]
MKKTSFLYHNNLLFSEGFTKPHDRALFGVCLYGAAPINKACTLLRGDVIGIKGVRDMQVIRSYNTKGKAETREIQVHPQLKEYLAEHHKSDRWHTRPHLFLGRHGRGHINKTSADKILRDTCRKLELEGISTHSFRRTALTRMSDAGVPLRHIQAISGHKTLAALERYLGVTERQKESAIATLDF